MNVDSHMGNSGTWLNTCISRCPDFIPSVVTQEVDRWLLLIYHKLLNLQNALCSLKVESPPLMYQTAM